MPWAMMRKLLVDGPVIRIYGVPLHAHKHLVTAELCTVFITAETEPNICIS